MVQIKVKKGDQDTFLFDSSLDTNIEKLTNTIVLIYNGRLKISRICSEIEELIKHGTLYPPEILGLTEEQVEELNLKDEWGDKCISSGGFIFNKDPIGRRNGRQPKPEMQLVLKNAIKDAKQMISKDLILKNQCLTLKIIQEALNILKGAVTIVYPMKLPPHDIIRQEFENTEDLTGSQASLDVLEPALTQLWFCGKEMVLFKNLSDYVGPNNKSKIIVKLQKKGSGAPAREPIISEEDRKALMLHAYRKHEELKKLEENEDDDYLNSDWADSKTLKRQFQGLRNISWKPK